MAGKEFFTSAEAADLLGLSKDTVRHYCQGDEPRIKGTKLGRDWLIPRSEIDRYERDRREVGRPAGQ
jgi:excisionase family DNA binding protein